MDCRTQNVARSSGNPKEFLDALETLFARMDTAYQAAAAHYGFCCTGCEDSCCQTLFYHHTAIEYRYLLKGFCALDVSLQDEIRERAARAWRQIESALAKASIVRVMCPLNFRGQCRLYAHRPMICRLHGIPHQLQRPGKGLLRSPGCELFMRQFGKMDVHPFDRTPLYVHLSALERDFRAASGIAPGHKIKLTIAQMLAGKKACIAGTPIIP